jgi:hypothetical protein
MLKQVQHDGLDVMSFDSAILASGEQPIGMRA